MFPSLYDHTNVISDNVAGQQKELLSASNNIIGWLTLIVLLFGVALSTIMLDSLFGYHSG